MAKGGTVKYVLIAVLSAAAAGGLLLLILKSKKFSPFKKRLVNKAKEEYEAWNDAGKRKEQDPEVFNRLKDYWEQGSDTFWSKSRMIGEAWSATFISYLMKVSGAADNFKYSRSHWVYIQDAIKNRKADNKNPFKGYRPNEVEIEKGDLVCYARQGGVGYDSTGAYKSHCDLVIDVKDNEAIAIGGNVSNSVSKTNYSLSNDGKLKGGKPFVVIKNKG